MRYRRVECTPPADMKVEISDNRGAGGWIRLNVQVWAFWSLLKWCGMPIHSRAAACNTNMFTTAKLVREFIIEPHRCTAQGSAKREPRLNVNAFLTRLNAFALPRPNRKRAQTSTAIDATTPFPKSHLGAEEFVARRYRLLQLRASLIYTLCGTNDRTKASWA